MSKRVVVLAILALVGVGVILQSVDDSDHLLDRVENRRTSRTISRLARAGLWVLWWKTRETEPQEVQHQVGADGYMTIDHHGAL